MADQVARDEQTSGPSMVLVLDHSLVPLLPDRRALVLWCPMGISDLPVDVVTIPDRSLFLLDE